MRYIFLLTTLILFSSCTKKVEDNQQQLPIKMNSESDEISFIISLKVNPNTTQNLNEFIEEITQNVINKEDFCLEYGYFVSEDQNSVTLYEKYENSEGAIKHGQNFIDGPFFARFFNLFTLENFIVTGPASDAFKNFTSENGFVIDYRESVDGFIR